MASVVYLHRVLDVMSETSELRSTTIGIARQAGYAAGGAVLGGLIAGPTGGLLGTIVGGAVGYIRTDPYCNLWLAVQSLSQSEKSSLGHKIQQLVGAVTVEEFMHWIQSEGHRQLILTLLQEAVKRT
ncbi:unnamed protein product [Gongylonema pulchrum]|uniref:Protein C19orf12 homolog n=1 Tax=Gongylonema pulchrum TaxID=637853 RepID=A0A183DUH4_9BILA|nr:unnamed protein product [Gongylonema pulchrum]